MEIPKSLQSVWNDVTKDGEIDAADFEKLKDAAAPNKTDAEFDETEVKFLRSLHSDLQKSGGVKGKIPVDGVNFTPTEPPKPVVTESKSITVDLKEVPTSLKDVWTKVTSDQELNRYDYEMLISAASPNYDDAEIDADELKFLENVRQTLGSQKSIEVKKPAPPPPPEVKPTENTGNQSKLLDLNKYTNNLNSDLQRLKSVQSILGVMDDPATNDLNLLVARRIEKSLSSQQFIDTLTSAVAKANPNDLVSLQSTRNELLNAHNNLADNLKGNQQLEKFYQEAMSSVDNAIRELQPKAQGNTQPKVANSPTPSQNQTTGQDGVPESLRATWNEVSADNHISDNDFEKLLQAASPTQRNAEFSDDELEFLANVKTIMDEVKDNPDAVDWNKQSAPVSNSQPSNNADDGIPASLRQAWSAAIADETLDKNDYAKLMQAAAPKGQNQEFDDQELEFLANIRQVLEENGGAVKIVQEIQNQNDQANTGASEFGAVPPSLKSAWQQIQAKGTVSYEDMNTLVTAAAPNGSDEELDSAEATFLQALKATLDENGGTYNLKKTAGSSPTAPVNSNPVLLNWPGYTQENKQALKDAYKGLTVGNNMPVLPTRYANQVAEAFGVTNVTELQQAIGAKADGKFGPETFFKAKAFVANALNQTVDPEQVKLLGSVLPFMGEDKEVKAMQDYVANFKPPAPQPEPEPVAPPQPEPEPQPQVDLGGVNPENKVAMTNLQKKINILADLYNKNGQTGITKTPTDGELSPQFISTLNSLEAATGQSPIKAVAEIEMSLKELGMPQLNKSSARFVNFQNNDFIIIGNPKDVTRIESAKALLSKLGINIGAYEIQYTDDAANKGDLLLKSSKLNIAIYDNLQKGRNSDNLGDLQIVGTVNGRDIDVKYWENDRRGNNVTQQQGRFRLSANINGLENNLRSNNSFLSDPLVRIE